MVERNQLDPALVDDAIMGCVMQVPLEAVAQRGRQCGARRRLAPIGARTSIDRQCGSSQQALHFAAQGVMAGAYDIAVAAGVESMT